ncbi:PIR Superfamily Protein [Plasmodium ovale curtisi]|uniref:PIR Superfamily Protein n=1 Tax=Plasmodium ovale curtisi TaxID=864141 RepID=A0A1A8WIW7_PLAOA|nr:PIR Superfamily Protein [Plasmodium ovale curtisi]
MSPSQGYEYCPYAEYECFKKNLNGFSTNITGDHSTVCHNTLNETIKGDQRILGYFKQLKMYLQKYNNSGTSKSSNSCRYINYWLNDKMRNLDELNPDNFYLFKKYAECEEHGQKFKCTSGIYLLPEEEYKSINELYELYDAYYTYSSFKSNSYVSCDYANTFTHKHNNLVYKCNYKENNNMCNELKIVRELFEKNIVETRNVCGRKLIKLLTIPDAYASEKIKASEFLSSISPMPVLPSIIVISVILLFLYKFTPIGSLFLRQINRKNIISNNLDEQTQEFLYNSNKENSNYEKRSYNIAYKSIGYF